jgi:DNA-binding NtrC family response regulator
MRTYTVLVAENDAVVARFLASSLDLHFRSVKTVSNRQDLHSAVPRLRVDAVIADLETVTLADVASLSRDYRLPVICTHRVPDDELWAAALGAGATDLCGSSDVEAIVRAIRQSSDEARSHAA